MTLIQNIDSRELLDSQGNATLECDVALECGALGRAVAVVGVPDDKRDDDPKRYWGKASAWRCPMCGIWLRRNCAAWMR